MIDDEQIMAEAQETVDAMDEAELEAEAKKLLAQRAKRKTYQKEKTPEQLELQKVYRKKKYAREKALLAKVKELDNYDELVEDAEAEAEEE